MSSITRKALVAALLIMGLASTDARADFKALSQKLPASSNSVIAINVAKLLKTPYAQGEEWSQNSATAWANQPVMIPKGSTRLLMAAEVQSGTMESVWEMSLIEMGQIPAVAALAAAEGGYVDRVWDKDAVCSPINAYFVPLDANTLASITPANRSAIAKWVRTPVKPEGNVTSEFIRKVVTSLGEQTDIVMAMDLEGAFSVPKIRRWLDDNEIKEIPANQLDEAARVLATMEGIRLDVMVGSDVNGRAVVEFSRDASMLAPAAKSIMLEVLNTAGMRIDDVRDWTFAAAGKQVTMQGKLSAPALRKLLGIVQSPIPAATTVAQKDGGGTAVPAAAQQQPNVPADPAQASQRYYKVICANLDNFRGGSSPSETATWARATAKRIDQLPILNVDTALVDWGTMVSTTLKQAAGGLAVGQTNMNARVAGIMDPTYSNYSYNEGTGYVSDVNRSEMENAKSQRRQAALEQRAVAQEQAIKLVSGITESRGKIRQLMVEKYKVEF
jgi:hypothetical protein